jgi:hypothetical protein
MGGEQVANVDRHTPVEVVAQNIEEGSAVIYGLPGEPLCMIDVRPQSSTISLMVAADTTSPRLQGLRNIAQTFQDRDGIRWNTLIVTFSRSPHDCYAFACRVADQIQLHNEQLDMAVDSVLVGWRDILRRDVALSREQEVGLFGELLVLYSLVRAVGTESAITSWIGPAGEEHDFGLPQNDLEVKTTASETRTHWISTPDQLKAIAGRELRLVSIMITPRYGDWSLSLPELTSAIDQIAGASASAIREKLEAVGYHTGDESLYSNRWMLRDHVLEYVVDERFPKITSAELLQIGITSREIPDLRYRLSLSGLSATTPSIEICSLKSIIQRMEKYR